MLNTNYNQQRRCQREKGRESNSLPTRFVLILTNKCNLKCNFCFQDRKGLPNAMSDTDWISFIRKIPENSHITLTGGEPLVYKNFFEIFAEASKKHTLNIISNGVMLTEEHIELFLSEPALKVLSISIDTIGNTNRDVPPFKYQSMKEILHLIQSKRKKSKNRNIILDAKTVVTEENIPDLFEIFRHCINELNMDTHSFQFLKGSDVQHSDRMFTFEDIFSNGTPYIYQNTKELVIQFEKVREYCSSKNAVSYTHPPWFDFCDDKQDYKKVVETEINKFKFSANRYLPCGSPWESAHVNADGKLFPCLAVDFGDVRDYKSLADLYESPNAQKFRQVIFTEGSVNACNRCGYLELKNP